ncbi:uncharacterized protein LOC143291679 [Babylonia areolata]|uniref:uncharacterized protein LOC143291679 n=1 Tax=Babylonia areolata TaxID=304850 RepID=UPI003FCF5FDC
MKVVHLEETGAESNQLLVKTVHVQHQRQSTFHHHHHHHHHHPQKVITISKGMRWRHYLRVCFCRKSSVVTAVLLVAACMMFYAAYRLLAGLARPHSPAPGSPPAPRHRPCVSGGGTGGGAEVRVCDDVTPDLGTSDSVIRGAAERFLASYRFWKTANRGGEEEEEEEDKEAGRRRRRGKAPVPLVVVEEHHDVIPYWFQAVEQGLLPSQGNVLLHVDGHADATVPAVNASFPLFHRPADRAQLLLLMQRNDMFITAAALTGLFSRYIWVVPPWEQRVSELLGSTGYHRYHVLAGTTRGRGRHTNTLCYCVALDSRENPDRENSYQCMANRLTDKVIYREQCRPRVHVLAEIVMEDKAIELLTSSPGGTQLHISLDDADTPWLGRKESILLDIDEDYYGVEAANTPLQDAAVDSSVVDLLSAMVSRIFCAQDARQEAAADSMFTDFLDRLHRDLVLCRQFKCEEQSHSAVETFSTRLTSDLRKTQIPCVQETEQLGSLVAFLVKDLFSLSGRQLLALSQVGICLRESPRTMGFDPSRGMLVCAGYNRPGKSAVVFHAPDGPEIETRSGQLWRMLHTDNFTPRIITLARSVRDGYTPRGSFQKIEEGVVSTLKNVYPGVSSGSVVYDSQLLGGHTGWPGRGQRLVGS